MHPHIDLTLQPAMRPSTIALRAACLASMCCAVWCQSHRIDLGDGEDETLVITQLKKEIEKGTGQRTYVRLISLLHQNAELKEVHQHVAALFANNVVGGRSIIK